MDRQTKKDYLITLIKQSELPTSKLNTLRMQWESIDLEKVADFLLDNGVDIVNPYSKLFESCLESIENQSSEMYGVDTIEFENPEEFAQHYCHNCGSQRCEGVGTEWFEGCQYKEHLKDYENFYGDE
jgi:hypothetical protein